MRIAIDPGSVQVSPGGKVSAVVGVRNSGPVADTFLLSVEGIAADWFVLGVASLTLGPGAEETTSLVIQPPIGAKTAAGKYTATVQLTSQDDPNLRTSAPLTVTVLSAGSVTMALSPLQAQGRKAFFNAVFTNHSNADTTMILTPDDDENALTFKMRPDDTVDVPSGESVTIIVRVRPEIRRLVGQPRAFTFSLTGAYENDPFPTKIDAALIARARFTYIPRAQSLSLPNWLWYPLTLIFKLLLILAALAFIFFLLEAIATGGTKKATAQPTEVSELQATIRAATLTPGNGKAAATAGVQLTAIAQGTTVLLAAVGPEDVGSITATATVTGTGKAGSKGAGAAKNTKVPAAPTPNITQFTLIPSGSYVAATWQVDGATLVQLNGKVVPINGAIEVPAGAAVALLQAFNGKSVAQQALPVPTLSVPAAGGAAAGGAAGGGSTSGGGSASGGSGSTGDASGGSGATGSASGSADAASGGTSASATPAPTSTPLPTSTPYPTSTPLPTQLPTSTLPPTATRTAAVIPTTPPPPPPTATAIPPTATASATDTATATAIPPTATATATDTATTTLTASPSASPSDTASPTATDTNTATDTATDTATATDTDTATMTPTLVPDTATATETATTVIIPTVTVITTESITGTDTITVTQVFRDTTTSSSLPAPPDSVASGIPPSQTPAAPTGAPSVTTTPTTVP